jgi:hypothetical protein
VPLLAQLKAERDRLARTVLPKSPLGDAVRYLTNQWNALQRFVDDGRLSIDNNRSENQVRVVAVGRNYAQRSVMRSAATVCPWRRRARPARLRIVHSRSRNARRSSEALKRPALTVGGVTRASFVERGHRDMSTSRRAHRPGLVLIVMRSRWRRGDAHRIGTIASSRWRHGDTPHNGALRIIAIMASWA